MQRQRGVTIAGHGIVRFLRESRESLVAKLAGVYESGVEQLQLLLSDHAGAAPVDGVEESLGVILEPHGQVSKLPRPSNCLPPHLDPLLDTDALLLSRRLRDLIEWITEVKPVIFWYKLDGRLEEIVNEQFVDFTESEIVRVVGVPLHVVTDTSVQAVKILLLSHYRDYLVEVETLTGLPER